MQFDLVILDHTYGKDQRGSDHLSAQQVVEHATRLRCEGVLKRNGRVFATHIAHEGNPPHPELAAFASQHGYEVANDGLILTVSNPNPIYKFYGSLGIGITQGFIDPASGQLATRATHTSGLFPVHSLPIFEATVDSVNRIVGLQDMRPSYLT